MIKQGFLAYLFRYFSRLRYPTLFLIVGGLFVANLFFPDPLPFVDEVMLGLLTVLVGKFKEGRKGTIDQPQDSDGKLPRKRRK